MCEPDQLVDVAKVGKRPVEVQRLADCHPATSGRSLAGVFGISGNEVFDK